MTESHPTKRTGSTRAKRTYSAPRLVVIDVANRTTTGTLGAQNDGTNAVTATVPGGS